MANIFNIQQDLIDIFNQIEDNYGEITPELEKALSIKEDEFRDKIQAYASVIRQLKFDIVCIKDEKARLDNLKSIKEKTIERLENIMRYAILQFGDESKSGSKFIDYGIGKISLRATESVELDDEALKSFTKRFVSYCNWLSYMNTFNQGEYTVKDAIDYCNKPNQNEELGLETNFTEEDLEQLGANIDLKINLKDIISSESGNKLMKAILDYNSEMKITPNIDKKELKDYIKNNATCPSFANLNVKQSVIIK